MPTILAINDAPNLSDQMHALLITAGYRVIRAWDGNESVNVLDERLAQNDLSIADLGLPGINGFEIIGAISHRSTRVKPPRRLASTRIFTSKGRRASGRTQQSASLLLASH
jgi:DNA-binding response OmpR family regulator